MLNTQKRLPALWLFLLLGIAVIVVAVAYLSSGVLATSLADTFAALWPGDSHAQARLIIWDIRLPRALTALVIGALLSICGALTQGLFRNPLADPGLIGVSSGSALGATLAIFLLSNYLNPLWSVFVLPLAAFVGGGLVTWLVYRIGLSVSGNILKASRTCSHTVQKYSTTSYN